MSKSFSKIWAAIPGKIRLISILFLTNLLIFLLLRFAFLFYFLPDNLSVFYYPILKALYLGFKFDARLAALICLPILLISSIPALNPFKKNQAKIIWKIYLILIFSITILIYVLDFGTFSYIKTRISSSLFLFARNPEISLKMICQSYPVIPIILFFLLFIFIYFLMIKRIIFKITSKPTIPGQSKWKLVTTHILFITFIVLIIYGKFARYPLRWSEAFFTPNSFISYLGVNPVLFLYKSFSVEPLNFDLEETKKYYPLIADYYRIDQTERKDLSLWRKCKPYRKIKGSPNIIFILLETFASFKVNVVKDGLDSSPNFNRLCKQGLYFPNFFVPTEMTSRSLFAFLFGIPDVSPGRYSSWNPLVVDQYSILNSFKNYDKCYFLGGSANWGNIRGVLSHNIKDLQIYEEGSYGTPVHDVWGISDADLFWEAHNVIKEIKNKPFIAFIQTSGNHRPFRIPKNNRGFKNTAIPLNLLKKNGFYSMKEYNGFRFLDHCLGYFISLAKSENFYDNTIFVLFGDHGTTGGATDNRFGDLSFGPFNVPFLIYAPELLKEPATISTVMSELDILPSIVSLTGKPYINTTLGRDIFNPYFQSKQFAFTYTVFRAAPRMGLVSPEFYLNMEPDGTYNLYRWDSSSNVEDIKHLFQEEAEQMAKMTKAIFEYSRYLLYNNKKENVLKKKNKSG